MRVGHGGTSCAASRPPPRHRRQLPWRPTNPAVEASSTACDLPTIQDLRDMSTPTSTSTSPSPSTSRMPWWHEVWTSKRHVPASFDSASSPVFSGFGLSCSLARKVDMPQPNRLHMPSGATRNEVYKSPGGLLPGLFLACLSFSAHVRLTLPAFL